MRFGPRELLFLLVLLAVPVLSYMYLFQPRNEEIEEAKLEIQHKEKMLEKLAETTKRTADLARANQEIRDSISVIEGRLPTGKEVDVILEQVAELARNNSLRLPNFKTDKPVAYGTYHELPLEMKVAGSFSAFYSFMLDLEKLERITRVPDMDIKRIDREEAQMEANFTLSIYFQHDDAEGA